MLSSYMSVGSSYDRHTSRQNTLLVSLVDVATMDVLALKKVQMQTWTRVGYFGNIFTIDHSWYISNLPDVRFQDDIQQRGKKDQDLYVGCQVTQAINRPASLSHQYQFANFKEDSPPCIATANR
jgi:hypothetical protein